MFSLFICRVTHEKPSTEVFCGAYVWFYLFSIQKFKIDKTWRLNHFKVKHQRSAADVSPINRSANIINIDKDATFGALTHWFLYVDHLFAAVDKSSNWWHTIPHILILMDFIGFYWIDCNYDIQNMRQRGQIGIETRNYCDFVLLSCDFSKMKWEWLRSFVECIFYLWANNSQWDGEIGSNFATKSKKYDVQLPPFVFCVCDECACVFCHGAYGNNFPILQWMK